MSIQLSYFNESSLDFPLDEKRAQKLFSKVMKALGKKRVRVRIIAKSDDDLREMKKKYFDQDVYTDVISFVLDDEPVLEGELYCSLERIQQNATGFSEPFPREFARILIHGACHLCGLDDSTESEREAMIRRENTFLTQYYDPK